MIQTLLAIMFLISTVFTDTEIPATAKRTDSEASKAENMARILNANHESKILDSGYFEGDILTSKGNRNIINDKQRYWENGVIPFAFDPEFTTKYQERVLNVMNDFHSRTNVRFRPKEEHDENWIYFNSNTSGCGSYIGMVSGRQEVLLNLKLCTVPLVLYHELMHVLGFTHQHNAQERDKYIQVHYDNIQATKRAFFGINNSTKSFGIEYDYLSAVHYGGYIFSLNGEQTISPNMENVTLGTQGKLSDKDIDKLNIAYSSKNENFRGLLTKDIPKSYVKYLNAVIKKNKKEG